MFFKVSGVPIETGNTASTSGSVMSVTLNSGQLMPASAALENVPRPRNCHPEGKQVKAGHPLVAAEEEVVPLA